MTCTTLLPGRWSLLRALRQDSPEDCASSLVGWIEYRYCGAYEDCTSILRVMYYVLVAERSELPHWPQSTRRRFTSKFPNSLDCLPLQLYCGFTFAPSGLPFIVLRLVLCNGTYITLNRARLINRRGLAIVWINCAAAHLLPSLGCLMRPVVAVKEGRAT